MHIVATRWPAAVASWVASIIASASSDAAAVVASFFSRRLRRPRRRAGQRAPRARASSKKWTETTTATSVSRAVFRSAVACDSSPSGAFPRRAASSMSTAATASWVSAVCERVVPSEVVGLAALPRRPVRDEQGARRRTCQAGRAGHSPDPSGTPRRRRAHGPAAPPRGRPCSRSGRTPRTYARLPGAGTYVCTSGAKRNRQRQKWVVRSAQATRPSSASNSSWYRFRMVTSLMSATSETAACVVVRW